MTRFRSFTLPVFCLLLAALFVGTAATPKPQITLRWFVETGTKGVASTLAFPVKIGRRTIHVKNPPVMSESDLLAANFKPAKNGVGWMAVLKFSHHAGRALSVATRNNHGRELVVLCNNRLLYAAKIDTVIGDGVFVIPGGINDALKQRIEELVEYNRRSRKLDEEKRP